MSRKKKRPGLATRMYAADTRLLAAFFCPYTAVPPMGGSGGDTSGYAGFRMHRFANPAICCPPRLATELAVHQLHTEATVPSNNPNHNSQNYNVLQHVAARCGHRRDLVIQEPPTHATPAVWQVVGGHGAEPAVSPDEVAHLCTTMLWLRSWWESHQDAVRALDRKAAAEVHDHFIDGAILARATARRMKLDLDETRIRNYRWGNSAQVLTLIVALPPAVARRSA